MKSVKDWLLIAFVLALGVLFSGFRDYPTMPPEIKYNIEWITLITTPTSRGYDFQLGLREDGKVIWRVVK